MDPKIYGVLFLSFISLSSALPAISSNSVLVALLDSHYTDLAELVEKALLLHTLEKTLSDHNITIFAPSNHALHRDLNPDFRRFLLQPANLRSLQNLLLFHIVPARLEARHWPQRNPAHHPTLAADEKLSLSSSAGVNTVSAARVVASDDITRPDGVIHGIERLLIPKSVQQDFNARRSLAAISAVIPRGAPVADARAKNPKKSLPEAPAGAPPALPIYAAMSPGPSLAPAPAPGPGGAKHHFDGESQVKDFIQTLLHYGGYNEVADILVNLTSLASEMGKLVSEGYVLTVLAPNDEAMAKLTADQLSESGAPENMMYYHIIPEYQTEESMYNAVKRLGQVSYDTLRLPEKVVAVEADGSVKFGEGDGSGYILDPDIYTDGRISVQGISNVLLSAAESKAHPKPAAVAKAKPPSVPRRGRLLEVACTVLGAVGRESHFSSCL